MPKGIPGSGKPKTKAAPPSEQTQRLLEAMQEIEGRLAEERRKDRARALLVAFVEKHGLAAADLREAARRVGAREVGDHPVLSKNAPPRMNRGPALKAAREAKGLRGTDVMRRLGLPAASSAISHWERGTRPNKPKVRAGLSKLLDLPKGFWDPPKGNGTATP